MGNSASNIYKKTSNYFCSSFDPAAYEVTQTSNNLVVVRERRRFFRHFFYYYCVLPLLYFTTILLSSVSKIHEKLTHNRITHACS